MPEKYIIGTEYLVLSRKPDDGLSMLEGTYLSPEDAAEAKAELHKKDPEVLVKIETRTVFNTSESAFKTPIDNPTEAEPGEVEASTAWYTQD